MEEHISGNRVLLLLAIMGAFLFFIFYASGGLPVPGAGNTGHTNATGFSDNTQVVLQPASMVITRLPAGQPENRAQESTAVPALAQVSDDQRAAQTEQAAQVEQSIQTAQARTSQAFFAEQERTRQVFMAEQDRTVQAFDIEKALTAEALSAQETAVAIQMTQTAGAIRQTQEHAVAQATLEAGAIVSALQSTSAAATLAVIDVNLRADRTGHGLQTLLGLIRATLYLSGITGVIAAIRCVTRWVRSTAQVRETMALAKLYTERRRFEEVRLWGHRKPWVIKGESKERSPEDRRVIV
jgi:hypothetical protein